MKKSLIFFLRIAYPIVACLFVLFSGAELIFLAQHKAFYFNKSQLRLDGQRGAKSDTGLVDKDPRDSVLTLGHDELTRGGMTLSANAKVDAEADTLTLRSLDGKPAFLEIQLPVNRLEMFNGKPHPYFLAFSSWVKDLVPASHPEISVEYRGSRSVSPPSYQYAFAGQTVLLTVQPHYLSRDIYFDADQRRQYNREYMYVRLSVAAGAAVFSDCALTAVRQYGDFQHADRFASAMGVFVQKINYRKNDALKRIIFLGGSTMYGASYTTVEGTIPKWFDLKLQSARPGRYEVLNMGATGATTEFMVNALRPGPAASQINAVDGLFSTLSFNCLDLRPDIVVIAPMYNDFTLGAQVNSKPFKSFQRLTEGRITGFIFRNCAVGYYLYSYLKNNVLKDILQHNTSEGLLNCSAAYRNNLDYVVRTLQARGAKVYLTALPNLALYRDAPEAAANPAYAWYFDVLKKINAADERIIRETAKKNNVRYIDVRAYFADFPPRLDKFIYYPDYCHLKGMGNAIAADLLWAQINGDLD